MRTVQRLPLGGALSMVCPVLKGFQAESDVCLCVCVCVHDRISETKRNDLCGSILRTDILSPIYAVYEGD